MYHPLCNPRRVQIKDPNFAFDLSTFKRDLKSSQMKSFDPLKELYTEEYKL